MVLFIIYIVHYVLRNAIITEIEFRRVDNYYF